MSLIIINNTKLIFYASKCLNNNRDDRFRNNNKLWQVDEIPR